MKRKRYLWKLKNRQLQLGDRTLLMGVLNVTPDSFSDGGKYSDPDRAFARAMELEEQGADIIDIGAESTRPGSARISEAEELRRLVPILKRLHDHLGIPVSVDTYKSAVARKALELGVEIINDPTGLTFDPLLAKVVLEFDAGLVLNHMRGTPETWAKLPPMKDPVDSISRDLEATVHRAVSNGVERARIAIDPGLGFGKRKEQNSEILSALDAFARLDLPLLVGPSRKAFLARPTEEETIYANAAAVAAAILRGAHIVRVHEVPEMKIAAEVADAIAQAEPEPPEEPEERPRFRGRGQEGPREESQQRYDRPPRDDAPRRYDRPPPQRGPDGPRDNPPQRYDRPPRDDAPRRYDRPPPQRGPDGPRDNPPRRYDRPPRDDAPRRYDRPPPQRGPDGPRDNPPRRYDRPPPRDDAPRRYDRPPPARGPEGPRKDGPRRYDRPPRPPRRP